MGYVVQWLSQSSGKEISVVQFQPGPMFSDYVFVDYLTRVFVTDAIIITISLSTALHHMPESRYVRCSRVGFNPQYWYAFYLLTTMPEWIRCTVILIWCTQRGHDVIKSKSNIIVFIPGLIKNFYDVTIYWPDQTYV